MQAGNLILEMRSKHFNTPYMQSPPPAVFHDKYQWEIWKNTAGKSATLHNNLFPFIQISSRNLKHLVGLFQEEHGDPEDTGEND